jgi:hypothetical protein
MGGGTGSFEIRSRGRRGVLFFARGQLVQAVAPGQLGREAALTVLGWREGTFATCEAVAPMGPPIEEGWQSLLMEAARQDDERRHSRPPSAEAETEWLEDCWVSPLATGEERTTAAGAVRDGGSGLMSITASDSQAVELTYSSDGEQLSGPPRQEIGEVVAYCTELAQRVGELLGLEPLRAAEVSGAGGALLWGLRGEQVAVVSLNPEVDPATHRGKVGL